MVLSWMGCFMSFEFFIHIATLSDMLHSGSEVMRYYIYCPQNCVDSAILYLHLV